MINSRYLLQTITARVLCAFFGIFPVRMASAMGGVLGRLAGPFSGRSGVALDNILRAMPELDHAQGKALVSDMWENLGRTFAEFPHFGQLDEQGLDAITEIHGLEHLEPLKAINTSCLFFSGHMANWEMGPKTMARCGFPLAVVYRKGNNPGLDSIIQLMRNHYQTIGVPKGAEGSRLLLKLVRERKHIGMLIDQKMNDGISVRFFGINAMTAPAIARLALKFDCPVVPVQVARTGGVAHRVTIHPPVDIPRTGNIEQDILSTMTLLNGILEGWIRENPAQWIWLHNRWPKNTKTDTVGRL